MKDYLAANWDDDDEANATIKREFDVTHPIMGELELPETIPV